MPARESWSEIWETQLRDLLEGRALHGRGLLGQRPRVLRDAIRVSRGDLLRRLVRPRARRDGRGRWRAVHRHRDDAPRARRAAAPHVARSVGADDCGAGIGGAGLPRSRGRARREPARPAVLLALPARRRRILRPPCGRCGCRRRLQRGAGPDRSRRRRPRSVAVAARRRAADAPPPGGDGAGRAFRSAPGQRVAGPGPHRGRAADRRRATSDRLAGFLVAGSARAARSTTATATSSTSSAAQLATASPTRAPTRRSGSAPRRSPSSTAPRPRSSAT